MDWDLPHTHGLLALLVPHSHNQHEHWADATLQKPQKESLYIEALKVFTDSREDETDAP